MFLRKALGFFLAVLTAFMVSGAPVPLEPGVVFVKDANLRKWQARGNIPSCKTREHFGLVLTNYDKKSTGSFTLSCILNVGCSGFDRLVYETYAYYNPDPAFKVSGYILTDAGKRELLAPDKFKAYGRDYISPALEFDIKGTKKISKMVLKVTLNKKGVASATFRRGKFILYNDTEYAVFLKHYDRYKEMFDNFLQPENYQPSFKLQYEIFFSNKQLESYRKDQGIKDRKTNLSNISDPAAAIYSNLGGYRPVLSRRLLAGCGGYYSSLFPARTSAYALNSLLYRDKDLMRLAARYMLALASFDDWNDNPYGKMTGHKASAVFLASKAAAGLALALDCAGEMLNAQGKNYVLRALLFKGVSNITYSLWDRSGALKMNQGVSFLRGKLAALAIFNKVWSGVMPEIKLVKDQADGCMRHLFTKNGGYLESVGYLNYTVFSCAYPFYQTYSQIVQQPLIEVFPQCVKKSSVYAEIIASTCNRPGWQFNPLGGQARSCQWRFPQMPALMAAICPNSMWVNFYRKIDPKLKKKALETRDFGSVILGDLFAAADKSQPQKTFKNFILLKDNAFASSLREFKGEKVKMVVVGDNAAIGKKYADVGSFVLEFAGDVFAMQMPVYNGIYFESQFRNMLVPETGKNLYAMQRYLLAAKCQDERIPMIPEASGDDKFFKARINVSNAWDDKYFSECLMDVDSPSPQVFNFKYDYTPGAKTAAAAVMWITYLPIEINGAKAVIRGSKGAMAELSAPGCTLVLDTFTPSATILEGMSMKAGTKCSRLIIRKAARAGKKDSIKLNCRLSLK